MPLPEHEQRQLQQIEQALYRDDPKFGRRMLALLGVVIGAGLLSAGAVTHRAYLVAVGVVIVLLSLAWAVVSWRRYAARSGPGVPRTGTATAKLTKHRPGQTRRARMMKRMEERWRRRQEGNGGMLGRTRS